MVLFAPLGSNSSHLISLAWALHEQWRMKVRAARLVLFARGARYAEVELLGPGAGLATLHAALGTRVMPRSGLRWVVPRTADGDELADDATDAQAELFYDEVLRQARQSIELAGADPVIFALVGGRRRTLSVATTIVAQHLARPQDRLVDIRYSDLGVLERPGQFHFPTQPDQTPLTLSMDRVVAPAKVEVNLVDVPFPRIGGLLRPAARAETYRSLVSSSQAAIDDASIPELVVSFARPVRAEVRFEWPQGGKQPRPLRLSQAVCLYLGSLALAAARGEAWLRSVRAEDTWESHPYVALVRRFGDLAPTHAAVAPFLDAPNRTDPERVRASLSDLRNDAKRGLTREAIKHGLPPAALVAETRRCGGTPPTWQQRLPCSSRIEFADDSGLGQTRCSLALGYPRRR